MSDLKKKLELLEIKQGVEAPGAKGIRIHPNTWKRLIQSVADQVAIVHGGLHGQGATFSGRPVDLDDTVEEETFEIISN